MLSRGGALCVLHSVLLAIVFSTHELQVRFEAEVVTMSAIAHILPAGVCSKSDVAMV